MVISSVYPDLSSCLLIAFHVSQHYSVGKKFFFGLVLEFSFLVYIFVFFSPSPLKTKNCNFVSYSFRLSALFLGCWSIVYLSHQTVGFWRVFWCHLTFIMIHPSKHWWCWSNGFSMMKLRLRYNTFWLNAKCY